MVDQIIRGPLLIPQDDGSVIYHPDGVLAANEAGIIEFAGAYELFPRNTGLRPVLEALTKKQPLSTDTLHTGPSPVLRQSDGVMLPPLLDIHTHIPQHPIRGRFIEGIPHDVPEGKLLAGLKRNVFPAEASCHDAACAGQVVRQFLADTLSHGVIGGAAYMTPSVIATEVALSVLPDTWSVGLVLMNQNCPENLRTDEDTLETDIERLANKFGRRLIVTDRFAVAVTTPLRRRGAQLAKRFNLRTQTHLNEQTVEKSFVEQTLYPNYSSYADVYKEDGLLAQDCITAHCIHMRDEEWNILRDTGSVIAHCPTSNLLLGSGVMNLNEVIDRGIPFALATDVGASPTVSMLAEMRRFMQVHWDRSNHATATHALFRSTLAPADILIPEKRAGRLEPGLPLSFIEVATDSLEGDAEHIIQALLPTDADWPDLTVSRVTIAGKTIYQRSGANA